MDYTQTKEFLDQLSTEDDVKAALTNPRFRESHHLDFKRDPYLARNADETQKDLGSMAFDGGFLLIGVDEGPPPGLHDFEIGRQAEILDGEAAKLSPPLPIRTRVIPSSAARGYLLVSIPPSASPVHLTQRGTAPWRNDVTTRLLTAGERAALEEDYRASEEAFRAILACDPFTTVVSGGALGTRSISDYPTVDNLAHSVRVAAKPVFPTRDLLTRQLQDDHRNLRPEGFAWRTAVSASELLTELRRGIPVPDDASLAGLWSGTSRVSAQPTETGVHLQAANQFSGLIDLSIESDGLVVLHVGNVAQILDYGGDPRTVIQDAALITLVREVLEVVRAIIGETSHEGPWRFGINATVGDAAPLSAQPSPQDPYGRTREGGSRIQKSTYLSTAILTRQTIEGDPKLVVRPVVGTLLHQWGVRPAWRSGGYL